jgi:hypothetical protein
MRTFMTTAGRALNFAAVAVLLAGCATAAQRQYQAIAVNTRATVQDARACIGVVHDSPEFAVLRPHVPPSPESPTLEQLSDRSLATDGEIRALFEVIQS